MSTDRVLERIRAANPAPVTAVTDEELFARIVAQPGDPRLTPTTRRRRHRWLGLAAAATVLVGAGGAGGAITLGAFSHASPKALFEADPAGQFSRRPRRTRAVPPRVIPQTVHRATSFTIPGVGRFEWWIALSRPNGWLCGAIRLPDGTWADLDTNDRSQVGGPMPGCGNLPWHDGEGFAYNQTSISAPGGRVWRIAYGYAPVTGRPVKIRDAISGATAAIGDGRYFAIVMPQNRPGYRLETLDATGRVLVADQFDPGM